jgi:hypothetical protein
MAELRLAGTISDIVNGVINGWLRRITADDADAGLHVTQSGAGDGLRVEMGANTFRVGPGAVPRVPKLEVDDAATYMDKDGGNNMILADAVTGVKTLAQLAAGGGGGGSPPQVQRVVVNDQPTYTTQSTSFVDIDATRLAITMTTGASWVLIMLTGTTWNTSVPSNMFDVSIDGVRQGGANGIHTEASSVLHGISLMWVASVSAGSHTFKPLWRVSAGEANLPASSSITPAMFAVIELL